MNDADIKRSVRSCFGKSRYRTEGKALLFADRAMKKRPVKLRVYPCSICAGFHLTSKVEGK